MAAETGIEQSWLTPNAKIGGGIALVVVILVVVGLIVYFAMLNNDDGSSSSGDKPSPQQPGGGGSSSKPWYKSLMMSSDDGDDEGSGGKSCQQDSDCSGSNVCGGGLRKNATAGQLGGPKPGCCPVCSKSTGRCAAGMITANGCQAPQQQQPSAAAAAADDDDSLKYGSSSVGITSSRPENFSSHQKQGAGGRRTGSANITQNSCTGAEDAYLRACFDKGDLSPACCGVCVNGIAYPGVRGADGVCQTTVQQTGYTGMGQQPPNTYIISSSGPKYGVTMGGCSVEPVGSGLAMYTAAFNN